MIASMALPALLQAIRARNLAFFALAFDLAIPPLTFLAVLLVGVFGLSTAWLLLGHSAAPFVTSLVGMLAFVCAGLVCWYRSRDLVPLASLGALVPFVLSKVALYTALVLRRGPAAWVRTARKE